MQVYYISSNNFFFILLIKIGYNIYHNLASSQISGFHTLICAIFFFLYLLFQSDPLRYVVPQVEKLNALCQ